MLLISGLMSSCAAPRRAAGLPTLADATQKDRQPAASGRIPLLAELILHWQPAACRRTVYTSARDALLVVIDHGIAISLVAALPSAQVFLNRSLVHFRSSRTAIYDRT
jgi:hypothetical protein